MAFTDSLSSCAPQANCHPPPPMAHAPTPIGVISKSLAPSLRFCISISWQFLSGTQRSGSGSAHVPGATLGVSLHDSRHNIDESIDVGRLRDKLSRSQLQHVLPLGVVQGRAKNPHRSF